MSDDTVYFYSAKDYLSNFYPSEIILEGEVWKTTEHFYQAAKATSLVDRQIVATAPDPGTAKYHGQVIKRREDWEEAIPISDVLKRQFSDNRGMVVELVKDHYMFSALIAKFTQHEDLRLQLLGTNEALLVENSPTDTYWGCGRRKTGLNKLGRMLMLVRSHLRPIGCKV